MMVFVLLIPLLQALQSADAPVPPCEAFRHPEEYLGRELVVDGVLLSGEHGAFLEASRECPDAVLRLESADKVSWAEYRKVGGRKGVGILATVREKIVHSKANRQPVFRISSVSNMRSLSN